MADMEAAQTAFEKFDIDGDGLITAVEFKHVMAELGDFHTTESVAQAVLNQLDGDGDGKISWAEFWASRQKQN
jgi:Ca2+-binding EF-hand superfamily protein